ncbi:hypothetical protein TSAR_011882 [Trichomalopsis sarcophagae]|uniref:Uncharacterized protein n=1 Tax=Trichomalopsis sarcophagae TaxID=543379 RepID=A0A232EJY2_9HYME|nr:hypothetical protein TSAR_011882 [Trichomalopsis sarcophagae]
MSLRCEFTPTKRVNRYPRKIVPKYCYKCVPDITSNPASREGAQRRANICRVLGSALAAPLATRQSTSRSVTTSPARQTISQSVFPQELTMVILGPGNVAQVESEDDDEVFHFITTFPQRGRSQVG